MDLIGGNGKGGGLDAAGRRGGVTVGGTRLEKILIYELLEERQYVTKGSDVWVYFTITGPELERLGPLIEDLLVGVELKDSTANFRFKVIGEKSYRADTWTAFASDVLPEQTAATTLTVGTAFGTRTDLAAPRIRLRIGIRNADTITTIENGVISMYFVVKLFS